MKSPPSRDAGRRALETERKAAMSEIERIRLTHLTEKGG